jgi:hypothetical protein
MKAAHRAQAVNRHCLCCAPAAAYRAVPAMYSASMLQALRGLHPFFMTKGLFEEYKGWVPDGCGSHERVGVVRTWLACCSLGTSCTACVRAGADSQGPGDLWGSASCRCKARGLPRAECAWTCRSAGEGCTAGMLHGRPCQHCSCLCRESEMAACRFSLNSGHQPCMAAM